jgi:hypothetical protein
MINIELDEKTKREVIEQAKKQLLDQLMAQFNVNQIGQEVRNKAINEASKTLAARLWETMNVDKHISRAIMSVRDRVNEQIHKKLKAGVTITFEGIDLTEE